MAWARWIAAGCIHGDQADASALRVLYDFTEEFKPTHRICLGDLFDFRPLRRNATAAERAEGVSRDWEAGLAFLRRWRPTAYVLGNHELRLWEAAESPVDGIVQDVARQAVKGIEDWCRAEGCTLIDYNVRHVYTLGPLTFVHGMRAGKYAPAHMAAAFPGQTVFAHTHSRGYARAETLDRREAWNVGCLRTLDPAYATTRHATLRWAHGFGYGGVDVDSGVAHVQLAAPDEDGVWRLMSSWREYHGP